MRSHIAHLALLFLFGWQVTGASSDANSPVPTELEPDPVRCFATPAATQFIIGIVGDGWAIQFIVPRDEARIPSGVLNPRNVSFFRGPEIHRYVRPSGGPPTPPLPKTDAYSVVALTDVIITAVGGSRVSEPSGYLEITLSEFVADGNSFVIDGTVRLPFRGPYP